MTQILLLMVSVAAGPALVLTWAMTHGFGCWSLVVPALCAATLTWAVREQLLARRRCLADCWFESGSRLYPLVRGGTLATLLAAVAGITGTLVLMASIAVADFTVVAAFALDGLLIVLLYVVFNNVATKALQLKPRYRGFFAQRVTVALNVAVMLGVLLYLGLELAPPDYLDPHLQLGTTLQAAAASATSACPWVEVVVQLAKTGEALGWWLMLRATRVFEGGTLRWIAWILFLASGSLSLWAYSTVCVRAVHFAHRRMGIA